MPAMMPRPAALVRRLAALVVMLLPPLLLPAAPARAAMPEIQRVVSPGGIEAWLVEDHRLPLITLRFDLQAGAVFDPPDKPGTASLLSTLLDEGAGPLDSAAFRRALEDNAISLSFSAGKDSFVGSLDTLSDVRQQAFDLLRLALSEPRFDADPVARMKAAIMAGLRRDMEDPQEMAGRAFALAMFAGHPYSWPTDGTLTSIAAITPEDLRAFMARTFSRQALLVTVVGDITAAELAPALDQMFGALPDQPQPERQPLSLQALGKVVQVPADVPQAVILFGHDWIERNDPRWDAARLATFVFGAGSFTSRLMQEVRERRGLTYGISTGPSLYRDQAMFLGQTSTVAARAAETVQVIRAQWDQFAADGITEAELERARTYTTGSLPLNLTGNDEIAELMLSMRRHDLPITYLNELVATIEAVTPQAVAETIGALWQPEDLFFVVVGEVPGLEPDMTLSVNDLFQIGTPEEVQGLTPTGDQPAAR